MAEKYSSTRLKMNIDREWLIITCVIIYKRKFKILKSNTFVALFKTGF